MALFSPSFLEDLKAQTNIVSVIGEVVSLKKTGGTYKGLCPFHQEKTPSFNVNPDKGFFKCFGCGAGGDVLKFVELHQKLPFPEAVRFLAARAGIRVANVFHAGDGNLHPLVLFDETVPGELDAAQEVSGAILDLCLTHGGSITGEHGVGVDKMAKMPRMFTADDLATMQLLRCAFDPPGLANPGKVFPTPRLCGEPPRPRAAPATYPAGIELW